MLVAKSAIVTGSQTIRSHALGVIALATTPTAQYATTTQMSFRDKRCQLEAIVRSNYVDIMNDSKRTAVASEGLAIHSPSYPNANKGPPTDRDYAIC
jgi:hypothetical protein